MTTANRRSRTATSLGQRCRWPGLRLTLFSLLTLGLAYEHPLRLGAEIPGDPGDAYLIMTLLEWGADRSVHLFAGYWDGPMFVTGDNAMAYTDTFLPLVIPFGILEWITGSRVLAFNLLYLASWVLCAEATYQLARRIVTSRPAAFVAALAFTFSTVRIAQSNHFQLAWAAFIPLGFLALFRLRERPTALRGVVLALVLVTQFLTSAYYGLILFVSTGVAAAVFLVIDGRRRGIREQFAGYGAALATIAILMGPIAWQYRIARESVPGRRGFHSPLALRSSDLLAPPRHSTFLRDLPLLDGDTIVRTSENYAYVGLLGIVTIPAIVWLLVTDRTVIARRRAEIVTIVATAAFAASVAVGPGPVAGIGMPFYDVYVHVLPGLDQMTALVRLFVFVQLALAVLSAVVIGFVFARIRQRWIRVSIAGCLAAILVVEASTEHALVEVVEPAPGSVHDVLSDLPPGIAVELPMAPRALGATYAFIEATRMVLGTEDDIRTVNGYSGYAPDGYADLVGVLNSFPAPAALDALREHGVDYVVIHTAPMETGAPVISDVVNASGYAFFDPESVEQMIDSADDALAEPIRADDGWVLVLATGR